MLKDRILSAMKLIATGQWGIFCWRLKARLRGLDLDYGSVEDLGLSNRTSHEHSETPGPDLRRVLKSLDLQPGSAILDFGCGKGGALMTMAQFPFTKIAGCDISPGLLSVAKNNMQKLGISGIRFYCCDARHFTDLDEYDYFYFFNPFPREVFEAVMANIAASLARRPRETRIIYRNPQCHEIVVADGLFERIATISQGSHPFYVYTHRMQFS